jgi:hypothetical protein
LKYGISHIYFDFDLLGLGRLSRDRDSLGGPELSPSCVICT